MNPKKKKQEEDLMSLPNIPTQTSSEGATIKNPDDSNLFNGLCQAFVEHATLGHTGVFPTAIDAWNQQQNKAVPGLQNIKPGDPIYFSANQSNNNDGHTGIYLGDNKFISATNNGIKTNDIGKWVTDTGQSVLGYLKR